jgi:hypothetical protein
VRTSMGKNAQVAPYSGAMLETVARSATAAGYPGQKLDHLFHHADFPETLCQCQCRSVAVTPGAFSSQPYANHLGHAEKWLTKCHGFTSRPPTPQARIPSAFTIGVWLSVPTRVSKQRDLRLYSQSHGQPRSDAPGSPDAGCLWRADAEVAKLSCAHQNA